MVCNVDEIIGIEVFNQIVGDEKNNETISLFWSHINGKIKTDEEVSKCDNSEKLFPFEFYLQYICKQKSQHEPFHNISSFTFFSMQKFKKKIFVPQYC